MDKTSQSVITIFVFCKVYQHKYFHCYATRFLFCREMPHASNLLSLCFHKPWWCIQGPSYTGFQLASIKLFAYFTGEIWLDLTISFLLLQCNKNLHPSIFTREILSPIYLFLMFPSQEKIVSIKYKSVSTGNIICF